MSEASALAAANALGFTLTALPHVSQVVISMSPKAPTFGENPFQGLCLHALGCRSSWREDLRVCSHLFYCFPGACCPCRVLPVLSVPAGHKGKGACCIGEACEVHNETDYPDTPS